jgi:hypothetical protein
MPIVHLSDSSTQAGAIEDHPGIVVMPIGVSGGNAIFVTAVATSGGNLRLIAWKVPPDGKSITRTGDSGGQAGSVSRVAISWVYNGYDGCFITGVRTAQGNLKLIAWYLDLATGKITRLSDSGNLEGEVSLISMCEHPVIHNRVIVAVRNAAGNLGLQSWQFKDDFHLQKLGDTAIDGPHPGAISHVVLGRLELYAFTAARTSSGNLKVIIWGMDGSAGLGSFKRLGDSAQQGGPISRVDAVDINGDLLVTAVRDSVGNLKLILWQVSFDGMTVTMRGNSGHTVGDEGDLLACTFYSYSALGTRVLTIVRTLSKTLKIIHWEVASSGAVTRIEDLARPGTVDAVAFAPFGRPALSAVRDASNQRLRLDAWNIDQG